MIITNPEIVRKVSIVDTLRLLKAGDSACYKTAALGAYISVYSAITRLNNLAGFEEFDLDTAVDGSEYIITRNPASI